MKNRAVFLDRDGVINAAGTHYYVHRIADMTLTPRLTDALLLLQRSGYLLIVITNQGGIARGNYTIADVELLHQWLTAQLSSNDVRLTEIYCCPHHDLFGKCLCRKPLPLLLQKAMARFRIAPELSYFIGDSPRDLQAAAAAGIRGILAPTDQGIWHIAQELCSTTN